MFVIDPLHQIEQGVYGKHIWPWIAENLGTSQLRLLDDRCENNQTYNVFDLAKGNLDTRDARDFRRYIIFAMVSLVSNI